MFGTLGVPELFIISVIALMVFGPAKLPDFGKSLGEAIRGHRKAINEADRSTLERSGSPTPPQPVFQIVVMP
jgi:sec-independent protein translocase protein TatA